MSRRQSKAPAMIYTVPVPLDVYKFSQSGQSTKIGSFKLGIGSVDGLSAIIIPEVLEEGITARFKWTIQEQSGIQYGSFVDSSKQVWSMKFDSPETAESFTIHVAIATGQALRDLFIYDLVEGKSEPVGEGDTVGCKWLGFTVSDGTIDETFTARNKLERVVLGDGSVIQGLDEGITGMKRGGKRIIVLPPNLANTRSGSLVPTETPQRVPVVFLVDLEKVKLAQGPRPSARGARDTREVASPSSRDKNGGRDRDDKRDRDDRRDRDGGRDRDDRRDDRRDRERDRNDRYRSHQYSDSEDEDYDSSMSCNERRD